MTKILAVSAACLLSSLSFASELPFPILEKSQSAGFVIPGNATTYHCQIYTDRVELTKTAGSLTVTTIKKISISGDLANLTNAAALGKIVNSSAPTDGPITTYQAIKTGVAGAPEYIKLKAEGSLKYENQAPEAYTLENFINEICN